MLANLGAAIIKSERKANAMFEADEDELVIEEDHSTSNALRGNGYQLSFMHHGDPHNHDRPYFFTSQLGAPHPSYHSNPLPSSDKGGRCFPARWTLVEGIKMPCESITAPRIRLGPQELETLHKDRIMGRIRDRVGAESNSPSTTTLNLSHQALGDPYQYEAFVTFMALNSGVRILNLNDNELEDITDLDLPNVVKLHLSHNNFVSFDALPDMPKCEELYLSNNFLSGFAGLSSSKFPKLRILNVSRNPVAHLSSYRHLVVNQISTVKIVDGQYV